MIRGRITRSKVGRTLDLGLILRTSKTPKPLMDIGFVPVENVLVSGQDAQIHGERKGLIRPAMP